MVRLERTFSTFSPHVYNVLSLTKLHNSVLKMKNVKSFIKVLKSSGPNIDPCGIPKVISDHSLKVDPICTLCLGMINMNKSVLDVFVHMLPTLPLVSHRSSHTLLRGPLVWCPLPHFIQCVFSVLYKV